MESISDLTIKKAHKKQFQVQQQLQQEQGPSLRKLELAKRLFICSQDLKNKQSRDYNIKNEQGQTNGSNQQDYFRQEDSQSEIFKEQEAEESKREFYFDQYNVESLLCQYFSQKDHFKSNLEVLLNNFKEQKCNLVNHFKSNQYYEMFEGNMDDRQESTAQRFTQIIQEIEKKTKQNILLKVSDNKHALILEKYSYQVSQIVVETEDSYKRKIENCEDPQDLNGMSYDEFLELKSSLEKQEIYLQNQIIEQKKQKNVIIFNGIRRERIGNYFQEIFKIFFYTNQLDIHKEIASIKYFELKNETKILSSLNPLILGEETFVVTFKEEGYSLIKNQIDELKKQIKAMIDEDKLSQYKSKYRSSSKQNVEIFKDSNQIMKIICNISESEFQREIEEIKLIEEKKKVKFLNQTMKVTENIYILLLKEPAYIRFSQKIEKAIQVNRMTDNFREANEQHFIQNQNDEDLRLKQRLNMIISTLFKHKIILKNGIKKVGRSFNLEANYEESEKNQKDLILRIFLHLDRLEKSELEKEIQVYKDVQNFEDKVIFADANEENWQINSKENLFYILVLQRDSFQMIESQVENLKNKIKIVDQEIVIEGFNKEESLFIQKKMRIKQFYLSKFIAKGGEGAVYEGVEKQQIEKELKIMESFEEYSNIIKMYDQVEISNGIYVLVLEKCEYSLYHEIQQYEKKEKEFKVEKLLKIIFDLLDGIIQFRIYTILHLDIKPLNILVLNGQYKYADFGISSIKKGQNQINATGYSSNYSPQEQIANFQKKNENQQNINFNSDVYALGKTFIKVLKAFQINNNTTSQFDDWIKEMKQIVEEFMVKDNISERKDCFQLHKLFFNQMEKLKFLEFQKSYVSKIENLINFYPYDINKDIPYYLDIQIYYEKLIIRIYERLEIFNKIVDYSEQVADQYITLGLYKKALKQCLKSQKIIENQMRIEDWRRSINFFNIGLCYQNDGKPQEALQFLQKSLEIILKFQNMQSNSAVARNLSQIAQCHSQLGKNQEALNLLYQALEIYRFNYDLKHQIFISVFNDLSVYYLQLGHFKKALIFQLEALDMEKQIYNYVHPDLANSFNNVGNCYFNLLNSKQAIKYFKKSLDMYRLTFKESHPIIAIVLNHIGCAYSQCQDYQNALNFQKQSLKLYKKIQNNEDHIHLAPIYLGIGNTYMFLENYNKAFFNINKASEIFQKSFEKHPDIATSLNNLGIIFQKQGFYQKALDCVLQAQYFYGLIFKDGHPDMAKNLSNIGLNYYFLKQYNLALDYLFKSVEMKKKLNLNSKDLKITLNNISNCYLELGNHNMAIPYLKQIVQTNSEQITQLDAFSLFNLAQIYLNNKDFENSLKYYLLFFEVAWEFYNEQDLQIQYALVHTAYCYKLMGDFENALIYYQQYHEIYAKIYNSDQSKLVKFLFEMMNQYLDCKQIKLALLLGLQCLELSKKSQHYLTKEQITKIHVTIYVFYNIQDDEEIAKEYSENFNINEANLLIFFIKDKILFKKK